MNLLCVSQKECPSKTFVQAPRTNSGSNIDHVWSNWFPWTRHDSWVSLESCGRISFSSVLLSMLLDNCKMLDCEGELNDQYQINESKHRILSASFAKILKNNYFKITFVRFIVK